MIKISKDNKEKDKTNLEIVDSERERNGITNKKIKDPLAKMLAKEDPIRGRFGEEIAREDGCYHGLRKCYHLSFC